MICSTAHTGGWIHKWHSFRRLYDYGIDVYFGSDVHFCTNWNSLFRSHSLSFVPLCIRNAKERGEMLNELLSTRHIYTSNTDGHQSQSTIYIHFVPYTNSARAYACVHFYHRRFGCCLLFNLFYSIALNSSGPSFFPLNSFACVRVRARTPSRFYTAQNV